MIRRVRGRAGSPAVVIWVTWGFRGRIAIGHLAPLPDNPACDGEEVEAPNRMGPGLVQCRLGEHPLVDDLRCRDGCAGWELFPASIMTMKVASAAPEPARTSGAETGGRTCARWSAGDFQSHRVGWAFARRARPGRVAFEVEHPRAMVTPPAPGRPDLALVVRWRQFGQGEPAGQHSVRTADAVSVRANESGQLMRCPTGI